MVQVVNKLNIKHGHVQCQHQCTYIDKEKVVMESSNYTSTWCMCENTAYTTYYVYLCTNIQGQIQGGFMEFQCSSFKIKIKIEKYILFISLIFFNCHPI